MAHVSLYGQTGGNGTIPSDFTVDLPDDLLPGDLIVCTYEAKAGQGFTDRWKIADGTETDVTFPTVGVIHPHDAASISVFRPDPGWAIAHTTTGDRAATESDTQVIGAFTVVHTLTWPAEPDDDLLKVQVWSTIRNVPDGGTSTPSVSGEEDDGFFFTANAGDTAGSGMTFDLGEGSPEIIGSIAAPYSFEGVAGSTGQYSLEERFTVTYAAKYGWGLIS